MKKAFRITAKSVAAPVSFAEVRVKYGASAADVQAVRTFVLTDASCGSSPVVMRKRSSPWSAGLSSSRDPGSGNPQEIAAVTTRTLAPSDVFIHVSFDSQYESLFLALSEAGHVRRFRAGLPPSPNGFGEPRRSSRVLLASGGGKACTTSVVAALSAFCAFSAVFS